MSALRSFDQTQAPGTGQTVEVPRSFQPEMDRALLDGNPRTFEFPASAASFSQGILSQIIVPNSSQRYILGGTAYLNFDVTITTNVTSPSASWAAYFSGGPTKSAASLIDRLSISVAGTTLVDINQYYIWHNMILSHASSQDYIQAAQVLENAFSAIKTGSAGVTNDTETITISLPLAVGLLNTTKAFPLWAFAGPMVINIQWASNVRALGVAPSLSGRTAGTGAATIGTGSVTYTGANLSLRCQCVDVDPEYIAEQRRQMAAGKMLTFMYDQAMGMQMGAGAASINFGVNTSSLLAVLGAQVMNFDTGVVATAPAEGNGSTYGNSWGYSFNELNSLRVYRDGTQLTSFPLCVSQRDDAFPVLQQALGILFSTSNASIVQRVSSTATLGSSGANCALDQQGLAAPVRFNLKPVWGLGSVRGGSVYQPAACIWGISTRKCSDDGIANQGVYCQQLQVTVDGGQSTAGTHFLFYIFSSALAIDASGNCMVKR